MLSTLELLYRTMASSSKSEQAYIRSSLLANPPLRLDGRSPKDYRPIALETSVAPLANGSAHVNIGGAALASHRDVDKVAFTGSTLTGRKIMESAAKSNLKKVSDRLASQYVNLTGALGLPGTGWQESSPDF